MQQLETWLEQSGRPVYIAGPLLGWSPELADVYDLTPWGILVRVSSRESPAVLPSMRPRVALFGEQVQLTGYDVVSPASGHLQVWLAWRTIAPTSRHLSVSARLHAPDGALLKQKDGRLASAWFPKSTLPEGQVLLTVVDLEVPGELPAGTVVRIVVYKPENLEPLLTEEGTDVLELGAVQDK